MKERELNHNNPELDSLRNLQKLQGKNSIGQEMQMKRKRKMMTEGHLKTECLCYWREIRIHFLKHCIAHRNKARYRIPHLGRKIEHETQNLSLFVVDSMRNIFKHFGGSRKKETPAIIDAGEQETRQESWKSDWGRQCENSQKQQSRRTKSCCQTAAIRNVFFFPHATWKHWPALAVSELHRNRRGDRSIRHMKTQRSGK